MSELTFKQKILMCIFELYYLEGYFQFHSETLEMKEEGQKKLEKVIAILKEFLEGKD